MLGADLERCALGRRVRERLLVELLAGLGGDRRLDELADERVPDLDRAVAHPHEALLEERVEALEVRGRADLGQRRELAALAQLPALLVRASW